MMIEHARELVLLFSCDVSGPIVAGGPAEEEDVTRVNGMTDIEASALHPYVIDPPHYIEASGSRIELPAISPCAAPSSALLSAQLPTHPPAGWVG